MNILLVSIPCAILFIAFLEYAPKLWRYYYVRRKHAQTFTQSGAEIEMKDVFFAPFKCAIFNHRFRDTVYELETAPFGMKSTLEVCTKCGGGRVHEIGGFLYYTPKAVDTYVRQQKLKIVNTLVKEVESENKAAVILGIGKNEQTKEESETNRNFPAS